MTLTDQPATSARRRTRHLGVLGTAARVVVGVALLAVTVGDGLEPVDALIGVVVANVVVFAALAARGRNASPLRLTGPSGHLINITLILTFYAFNTAAANLFYAPAMLLAATRGYGACEMFAVWNWVRRRDDRLGCPIFLPVDLLDH